MRTWGIHPQAKAETSRFPRNEFPHMLGSQTTPDKADARKFASAPVAFRNSDHVGIRNCRFRGSIAGLCAPSVNASSASALPRHGDGSCGPRRPLFAWHAPPHVFACPFAPLVS